MAVTRTAKGPASSKTSGTTLALASVASTAGRLLVVSLTYDDATLSSVFWGTQEMTLGDAVLGAGVRTRLAWCVADATATRTITATWATAITAKAFVVSEYASTSGLELQTVHNGTNIGTGTSASVAAIGPIQGGAESVTVGVVGTEGPSGDTAGTWAEPNTNGQRVGTTGNPAAGNVTVSEAYRIAPTAGSSPALSKTGMTSRDWGAAIRHFYWAAPPEQHSGPFSQSHGHTASSAGRKAGRGAAGAVPHGHAASASGAKTGATGALSQSHGHSTAAAGRTAKGGALVLSIGHSAAAVGEKSSEEQSNDRSGTFSVQHGHSSAAGSTAGRRGGFASGNGHSASASGRKQARGGLGQVQHGHSAQATGRHGGRGGIAVSHGHVTAAAGRTARRGGFTAASPHSAAAGGSTARRGAILPLAHGHAAQAGGTGEVIEQHSGGFAASHGHAADASGSRTGSGGFALGAGHVAAVTGRAVSRTGAFSAQHPHSTAAAGSSGPARAPEAPDWSGTVSEIGVLIADGLSATRGSTIVEVGALVGSIEEIE